MMKLILTKNRSRYRVRNLPLIENQDFSHRNAEEAGVNSNHLISMADSEEPLQTEVSLKLGQLSKVSIQF